MTAEALHYRESLAIEEAISKDKQKQIEWEKSNKKLKKLLLKLTRKLKFKNRYYKFTKHNKTCNQKIQNQ